MTISDYFSLASVIISIGALAYTHITNTKKYELFSQYKNEILNWFFDVSEIIIRLKLEDLYNYTYMNLKRELLSKLSALIERGRFYFPDIVNDYGLEKSSAYRGYRNVILDFLVFSYRLFERDEVPFPLKHAETLQKYLTSNIFDIINPRRFLKETEKYTACVLSTDFTFEKYMASDPDLLETYIRKYNKGD